MTHIPFSREVGEDAGLMDLMLDDMLWSLGIDLLPPPTEAQLKAGYATYSHGDHEHTIEVGWRKALNQGRREFLREAEMVACPYVACECGHHEP